MGFKWESLTRIYFNFVLYEIRFKTWYDVSKKRIVRLKLLFGMIVNIKQKKRTKTFSAYWVRILSLFNDYSII